MANPKLTNRPVYLGCRVINQTLRETLAQKPDRVNTETNLSKKLFECNSGPNILQTSETYPVSLTQPQPNDLSKSSESLLYPHTVNSTEIKGVQVIWQSFVFANNI